MKEYEYTIISHSSELGLILKVKEYMKRGWSCQGGVSTVKTGADIWDLKYIQAMVKEYK